MKRDADVVVMGGGSWGTAIALHMARAGRFTRLWVRDAALARRMQEGRENDRYLPGWTLPDGLAIDADLGAAIAGSRVVILAVPAQHARAVLESARPHLDDGVGVCSASKGIECGSLMRVSEVIRDVTGPRPVGALSGPSFAREVADGQPTAVVVGSGDAAFAKRIQTLISAGPLRAYTNHDLVGVEIGGALKNVIAIGAGAVEGLGYGTNTLAALITRGLAEIGRLAAALGGEASTLAGLAGLGDLVLTCTGKLSRNRALGAHLARGGTWDEYRAGTPMVAEGVATTASAWALAGREGCEMPITQQVHAVLHESRPVDEAIRDLLARRLTREEP